jgi:ENTS family enterobactin (siderophore) exporter
MLARLISLLGLGLLAVAVPFQVYHLTGSTAWVGAISAMGGGGMFVGLLMGGVWADSYDRRRLILVGRGACGLGFAGLALNSLLPTPSLSLLAALTAWDGFFSGLSVTALTAAMPLLVGRENLLQARALGMLTVRFATVVSPLIGGLLIAAQGVTTNYGAAALATALTTITLFGLPAMPPRAQAPASPLRKLAEAACWVGKAPVVLALMASGILVTASLSVRVLFPALLDQGVSDSQGQAIGLGILLAMVPLGATLGALFSGWMHRCRWPGRLSLLAVLVCALSLLPLALIDTAHPLTFALPVACLAMVVQGAASSVAGLIHYTLIQHHTPDEALGRVNGLWTAQEVCGGGLSVGGLGLLGGSLGAPTTIVALSALLLMALALCWWRLPRLRQVGWQD